MSQQHPTKAILEQQSLTLAVLNKHFAERNGRPLILEATQQNEELPEITISSQTIKIWSQMQNKDRHYINKQNNSEKQELVYQEKQFIFGDAIIVVHIQIISDLYSYYLSKVSEEEDKKITEQKLKQNIKELDEKYKGLISKINYHIELDKFNRMIKQCQTQSHAYILYEDIVLKIDEPKQQENREQPKTQNKQEKQQEKNEEKGGNEDQNQKKQTVQNKGQQKEKKQEENQNVSQEQIRADDQVQTQQIKNTQKEEIVKKQETEEQQHNKTQQPKEIENFQEKNASQKQQKIQQVKKQQQKQKFLDVEDNQSLNIEEKNSLGLKPRQTKIQKQENGQQNWIMKIIKDYLVRKGNNNRLNNSESQKKNQLHYFGFNIKLKDQQSLQQKGLKPIKISTSLSYGQKPDTQSNKEKIIQIKLKAQNPEFLKTNIDMYLNQQPDNIKENIKTIIENQSLIIKSALTETEKAPQIFNYLSGIQTTFTNLEYSQQANGCFKTYLDLSFCQNSFTSSGKKTNNFILDLLQGFYLRLKIEATPNISEVFRKNFEVNQKQKMNIHLLALLSSTKNSEMSLKFKEISDIEKWIKKLGIQAHLSNDKVVKSSQILGELSMQSLMPNQIQQMIKICLQNKDSRCNNLKFTVSHDKIAAQISIQSQNIRKIYDKK